MTEAKNKKILVTGGTGLLGSYLLRYLADQGYTDIRALRRKESSMALVEPVREQIHWLEGDILDIVDLEEAMEDVQQVYHCAAKVSFQPGDRKELMRVNKVGTENVVNTALYSGVEKLLYVSSVAALGKEKHVSIIDENQKWTPGARRTHYGLSKYLAEQEAWRAYAEGLPVVIVNPSTVLGSAHWDRGPQQLFTRIWKGLSFYPQGVTGFVDVRDVARFMIRLMESNIEGRRYIVSSENRSLKQVTQQIAQVLEKPPPTHLVTSSWVHLFWRLEKLRAYLRGRQPLVTRETARIASSIIYYSNQRSVEELGFEYTPLDRSIREIGRQFLDAAENGFSPRVLPLL